MKSRYPKFNKLFMILSTAFIALQISCNLFDNNIDKSSDAKQHVNDAESSRYKTFSNCLKEKEILLILTKRLNENIQELKRQRNTLQNNQLQWDTYIAHYNRKLQEVKDTMNSVRFNCISQPLVDNFITASVMMGFYFKDGPSQKSKFYESKFQEFRLLILNELKSIK